MLEIPIPGSAKPLLVDDKNAWIAKLAPYLEFVKGHVRTARGINIGRLVLLSEGVNLDGLEADHCNRDPLDNRVGNLRPATHSQNIANSVKRKRGGQFASKFRGVSGTRSGRFTSSVQGKHLGTFDSEVDAAMVHDKAAREIWGEFAVVNFPEQEDN